MRKSQLDSEEMHEFMSYTKGRFVVLGVLFLLVVVAAGIASLLGD